MATQTLTSSELSNAQWKTVTKIYEAYQNKTDILAWIDALPNDKINSLNLQVPFEVSPNPSLAIGTGNNDVFATAQSTNLSNMNFAYVNMNAGTNQTYAALLNNNINTSEDVIKFALESDARQFNSFLNAYVSRGDGTAALATVSTNYAGGTPTLAVCNGSTDSIGVSQLVTGGYYLFYDATGVTQRTGTVGAGAIQLSSKSTTTATFGSNITSDVVATDIIVPQIRTTDASAAVQGFPIIIDSAGTYGGLSRSSNPGLQSFEKAMGGSLTVGALSETFASVAQRGGYFSGNGSINLEDQVWIVLNTGNWNNYYTLALNSGAAVGSPHVFRHTAGENPKMDFGMASTDFTYFNAPIKIGNQIRGDEIYFVNRKYLRKAILKPVGRIAEGMPQNDWMSNLDTDANYLQGRLRWMDFWGQVYSPQPFCLGKISGVTLVSPVQKVTNLYG